MNYSEKLKSLNIIIKPLIEPVASYKLFVQSKNTLYLSGHIAKKNDKPWVGKLGFDMNTVDGIKASRLVALDLLSTLYHACNGDLNKVKKIVKLLSLVNSTTSFTEHHLVTNGASELFIEVFGDIGKHSRSAFGVSQLPFGSCLEIELIVDLY
tara:strand:- start:346 stop:804 length:459 start_codon:yes stop_codon:yes gene_type:complete